MSNIENSIDYENFERLHVIRRLRQIVGSWWKVQLNFTDTNGFLRGVPQGQFFNPENPVCQLITENDKGFDDCRSEAKERAKAAINSTEPQVGVCHSGFSTLTLPLRIGEKTLGCIFADGFLLEDTATQQKEQVKKYLAKRFADNTNIDELITSLPVLGKRELEYLIELLKVVIEEVISSRKAQHDLDERVQILSGELHGKYDFSKMVGTSAIMQKVITMLSRVCESETTILITGENGTGKEIIARAIHYNSKRKNKNFIIQNCGALNDNLLESELFGHVKGSFTNAIRDKKGLFESADKGTLFLDEIGDTSPSMQVKLLRILQEGTFSPVGSSEQKHVDVRILAATNKNLEEMVKDGSFREDLYYRLNVINLKVPALRERKDDIILLADKFLSDYATSTNGKKKKLQASCIALLENYDWPGNVRELQNEIERICVLSGADETIASELLSEKLLQTKNDKFPGVRLFGKLRDAVEELERKMIFEALIRDDFNKSRAAKKLGISRAGLIMKCEKYELNKDDRFNKEAN